MTSIALTLLYAILALLVADFITGVFHWAEDVYCVRGLGGFLGDQVCDPNLLHHKDQVAFTRGTFVGRNWITVTLSLPFAAACAWLGWWVVAAGILLSGWGNQVHAWSHVKPKHASVRMLQQMGLMITPAQHAKHHKPPYDKCYCTVTNWLNPPLDAVRFWRGAEWLVWSVTGVKPR